MSVLYQHKKTVYGVLSVVGFWVLAYIFYLKWVVGSPPTELQAKMWVSVTVGWLAFGLLFIQYDAWKTNKEEA